MAAFIMGNKGRMRDPDCHGGYLGTVFLMSPHPPFLLFLLLSAVPPPPSPSKKATAPNTNDYY